MQRKIPLLVLLISLLGISIAAQTRQPKTVRDFFSLLPRKYFTLEGCFAEKDRNCDKARAEYIRTFLEVEDTANGYWKSGCDGAQACLEMALFKRPNGTYVVGLKTSAEMSDDNYFLEYRNGRWFDVSSSLVPQFSKNNVYELPRYGTKIEVFAKKVVERGKDYVISEKGSKIYDLIWEGGRFTIKR